MGRFCCCDQYGETCVQHLPGQPVPTGSAAIEPIKAVVQPGRPAVTRFSLSRSYFLCGVGCFKGFLTMFSASLTGVLSAGQEWNTGTLGRGQQLPSCCTEFLHWILKQRRLSHLTCTAAAPLKCKHFPLSLTRQKFGIYYNWWHSILFIQAVLSLTHALISLIAIFNWFQLAKHAKTPQQATVTRTIMVIPPTYCPFCPNYLPNMPIVPYSGRDTIQIMLNQTST